MSMQRVVRSHVTEAKWRPRICAFFSGNGVGIQGVAAVELALLGPMAILMLVVTFDLGMGIYRNMQVQNAAQAGAQYAIAHGFGSQISNVVTSATSFSAIAASPAPSKFCGCPSSAGVTVATCSSTCTSGMVAGTYVSVSSQGTYTTILPYPLIRNSFPLTAQSTVRIQ
jgi:Flp pilus assembly protein TadG